MYTETLHPSEKDKLFNIISLVIVVISLVFFQRLFGFVSNLPNGLAQLIFILFIAIIIYLCCRIYYRMACSYRYTILQEEMLMSVDKKEKKLQKGTIIIERLFGNRSRTVAVIVPDVQNDLVPMKKSTINAKTINTLIQFNGRIFTNRKITESFLLSFSYGNKNYICFVSPSELFIRNAKDFSNLHICMPGE